MTLSTMSIPTGGCAGPSCADRDSWPLHHVRLRGGALSRLCTSCVLKSNPSSFCSLCFDLLADTPPSSSSAAVLRCLKCAASAAHRTCLSSPDLAPNFVCASCKEGASFSYFPKESRRDGRRRPMDVQSAKVLLAAARISASSMSKAAAAIRADAERKVMEAVIARKRARDMLEMMLVASAKKAVSKAEEPPRKKTVKTGLHTREIEKWMRFHEPVVGVQGERDSVKEGSNANANAKRKEGKEGKEVKEGKEGKEVKEGKEGKEVKEGKEGKEGKERKGNSTSLASNGNGKEEEKQVVQDGEKQPRLASTHHGGNESCECLI